MLILCDRKQRQVLKQYSFKLPGKETLLNYYKQKESRIRKKHVKKCRETPDGSDVDQEN